MNTETWYEIEYSTTGADDWYSSSIAADSETSIKEKLSQMSWDKCQLRAVRKTLTVEAL